MPRGKNEPGARYDRYRRCEGGSPEQVLAAMTGRLAARDGEWWARGCWLRRGPDLPAAEAVAYRTADPQTLLVVGDEALAAALEDLLAAGAAPGWHLVPLPLPDARRPLSDLSGCLRPAVRGRWDNLLRRAGFAFAEEVAALPDECLRDFPNAGKKYAADIRQALEALASGSAQTG